MTREQLAARGVCCGLGCINCPYEPKYIKGNKIMNTASSVFSKPQPPRQPVNPYTVEGRNYINGEFVAHRAGDEYPNINPATGETLGLFPQTTPTEVSDVYGTARTAFNTWKTKSRTERAEVLYRVAKLIEERRDGLARVISLETGKNYNESIAEVNEALHMAQFAFGSGRTPTGDIVSSELAEKDSYICLLYTSPSPRDS